MTNTNREPTLQDLADKLDRLSIELDELRRNQSQGQQWQERFQEQGQRSMEQGQQGQDRTWDVVKWVGGISAGLTISASIALVGIVLKQLGQ
jgi:TolA-binding protein